MPRSLGMSRAEPLRVDPWRTALLADMSRKMPNFARVRAW